MSALHSTPAENQSELIASSCSYRFVYPFLEGKTLLSAGYTNRALSTPCRKQICLRTKPLSQWNGVILVVKWLWSTHTVHIQNEICVLRGLPVMSVQLQVCHLLLHATSYCKFNSNTILNCTSTQSELQYRLTEWMSVPPYSMIYQQVNIVIIVVHRDRLEILERTNGFVAFTQLKVQWSIANYFPRFNLDIRPFSTK